MRYALIKNNKVVNVIKWNGESEYQAPEGAEMIEINNELKLGVGYEFIDGEWVAPPIETEGEG